MYVVRMSVFTKFTKFGHEVSSFQQQSIMHALSTYILHFHIAFDIALAETSAETKSAGIF